MGLIERIDEYRTAGGPWNSYVSISRDSFKLYFIQEGLNGSIKIGLAKNPNDRLASLQTGNSKKLRILWFCEPKSRSVERDLHRIFNSYRLSGEWFEPSEDLLRVICETIIHCHTGQWFPSNEMLFNEEENWAKVLY